MGLLQALRPKLPASTDHSQGDAVDRRPLQPRERSWFLEIFVVALLLWLLIAYLGSFVVAFVRTLLAH